MRIAFTVDNQKKLNPDTDKDRRAWQALRNKQRPGARIIFEIFQDRSTKQHRLLWSIYQYMIFASEKYAGNKADDLHASKKWEFCLMRPEYFREIPVYYNGKRETAKVPFSESPNGGIDSDGMNEYTTWVLNGYAQDLGITVPKLLDISEKHRKGIDE